MDNVKAVTPGERRILGGIQDTGPPITTIKGFEITDDRGVLLKPMERE
jgi:hypothetical protein